MHNDSTFQKFWADLLNLCTLLHLKMYCIKFLPAHCHVRNDCSKASRLIAGSAQWASACLHSLHTSGEEMRYFVLCFSLFLLWAKTNLRLPRPPRICQVIYQTYHNICHKLLKLRKTQNLVCSGRFCWKRPCFWWKRYNFIESFQHSSSITMLRDN